MKMEQAECSETSAHKIQTPASHPKERIQNLIFFFKKVAGCKWITVGCLGVNTELHKWLVAAYRKCEVIKYLIDFPAPPTGK
jgi:hypothetical protein